MDDQAAASARRLEVLLAHCGSRVITLDQDGRVEGEDQLFWESAMFAGFDLAAEQAQALIEAAGAGRAGEADVACRRPDGEAGHVRLRVAPVPDGSGGVEAIYVLVEDRTREHDLKVRERLLRAVIEQSTELVAYHGPVGKEARINPAGAAMVGGLDPDLPLDCRIRQLFTPESQQLIDEVGSPQMEATGSWRADLKLANRLTGALADIDWAMFLLRDENGEVTATAGMGRDVTERNRAQEALRAARDEADRANQAKSLFLSRMSHELRTPLNAILGFAQLLDLDEHIDESREEVVNIMQAGRHLLHLIDDVLELSRIEAGQLVLSLEPVACRALLGEVVTLAGPLAAAAGLDLVVPAGEGSPHAVADHRRLKQVILNLVGNAIKYTRRGGTVTLGLVEAAGTVRLSVADTGVGIPAELFPRLFKPFDRLGAETSEVEGAGLGLTVARELTLAMHGQIDVVSEVGTGSTFTVTLPTVAAASEGVKGRPSAADLRQRLLQLPARTLVYIEDNPLNRRLVEALLNRAPQVKLICATTGIEGIELVRASPPDLLLLDLNLPDLDGSEVIRRLREHPATASVPVVVLTADAHSATADRLRREGAVAVLHKPLELEELAELLER